MNKTITLFAALAGFAITAPAWANDVQNDKQDIQADVNAIQKDNIALEKDRHTLRRDRAAKAADKANGNAGKQAADSVRIGTVQSAIKEKEAERQIDRDQLSADQEDLAEDSAKANGASRQ